MTHSNKLKTQIPRIFWNRQDTSRVATLVFVGLVIGIMGRWVYVTAPPLPVQASGPELSAATNAPAILKSEGASRSARD